MTKIVVLPTTGPRKAYPMGNGSTTGVSLSIVNVTGTDYLAATLLDGAVTGAKLSATNGPSIGYVPSYDTGGGFTWIPVAGGYTDEQAQDAVGSMVVNGGGITWTYNDGANQLSAAIAASGVSATSYGSASSVATFTVGTDGRLTTAATTAIAIATTQVTSGTFADARIAQSSVTQHQSALSIAETQITDGSILARLASNETVSGTWAFSNSPTVPSPTNANHAANQAYVDARVAGQNPNKLSVRALSTTNINLSSMPSSVGGVTLAATERFAVTGQSTGSQNGLYVFNGVGVAATRATDADDATELTPGSTFWVNEGTNADTGWTLITDSPIVVGTTALTFTQTSGLGQVTAGSGLTKTANQLDIGTASSARIVINADNIDLATTTVSANSYGSASSVATFTVDAYGRLTTAGSTAISVASTAITDFTEAAQDAVGAALTNTTTINLSYNDGSNQMSAVVNSGSLTLPLVSATNAATVGYVMTVGSGGQVTYVNPLSIGGSPSITVTTSEALAAGDLVDVFNDVGTVKVRKANATDNTKPAWGYVLSAYGSGVSATVYTKTGTITGLSGLSLGARYYLAKTGGGITTDVSAYTAGNVVQYVGRAVSATSLDFMASDHIEL